MAQTTPRGISYDESTDDTAIWTHLQSTATTADTAIGVVETPNLALKATQPVATALVTATITGTSSSLSQAFTWPASRFTQAPATIVTNNGGSGSSQYYVQCTAAPTTSGGTVVANQRDGTSATLTLFVHIYGIQMTSGSGFG